MSIANEKIEKSIKILEEHTAPFSQTPSAEHLNTELKNLKTVLAAYQLISTNDTIGKAIIPMLNNLNLNISHKKVLEHDKRLDIVKKLEDLPNLNAILIDLIDHSLIRAREEFKRYDSQPVRRGEETSRSKIADAICTLEKEIDVIKHRQNDKRITAERKDEMTRALHDHLRSGLPFKERKPEQNDYFITLEHFINEGADVNLAYESEQDSMEKGKKTGLKFDENPVEYAIRMINDPSGLEEVRDPIKSTIMEERKELAEKLLKILSSHGGVTQTEHRNLYAKKIADKKFHIKSGTTKPENIEKSKNTGERSKA